ncbi:hypothetical protein COU57_04960 [Candidatus Pacearchaeota archaeon CG10_big_fil_rev_8_21_14_0_10_32_14]|nr:MAG: hypothetical protein COU57_04960 [Candidatus Pacearchaeota archaeon CG10_big_fil_rev_8_21_14_0_10_32_14]
MKSYPYYFVLGALYWGLPILMYIYRMTHFVILLPFGYYYLWFPFLFIFIEYSIKKYEIKINSPVVKYHEN